MQTVTLNRAEVAEIIRGRIPDWFKFEDVPYQEFVVPVIPDLDAEILKCIEGGGHLNMLAWHQNERIHTERGLKYSTCGTTHCRAGWAIALGGEEGVVLEQIFASGLAGALIYQVSTGRIPDFYASNQEAMLDMKCCAALTEKEGFR